MYDRAEETYLQNRELSWLTFNRRVLEEAEDHTVPLLERLKFIAIFTSNLDEFFMVRVGRLINRLRDDEESPNKTNRSAGEQLPAICARMESLYWDRDRVYAQTEQLLRQYGIAELTTEELTDAERSYIAEYYERMIRPCLSPQIIDSHHPFPHIGNKVVHIAVRLKDSRGEVFGIIPTVPSLARLIRVSGNKMRYILQENILLHYADDIFARYEVMERAVFCITRSDEMCIDEDIFGEEKAYSAHMKRVLKKRSRLTVVRLELGQAVSKKLLDHLLSRLQVERRYVWTSRTPLEMSYVMHIGDMAPPELKRHLSYASFVPQKPAFDRRKQSVIEAVTECDRLLCYPYHTFDTFIRLIREAAFDEAVISIKITVYRLAKEESQLMSCLIKAAERGKEVIVLMELKARFDEQNNIEWAERLEKAGCHILFGIEGIKVHSKICLITRRDGDHIRYITQVGTGNYNENTAGSYTDLSLITADARIGKDAVHFFQNMATGDLKGTYEYLLVAPYDLRERLLSFIDREILRARCSGRGRIIFKMNALTDKVVIAKLCEASCAGVKIDLVVRGICCLLPNIKGKTENITVRSIVGRFLEHSRIYVFGEGETCDIYLSSADMMTRNTERRVEIACPVWDMTCKRTIIGMLTCMLQDDQKARLLTSDGKYEKIIDISGKTDSQETFMKAVMRENDSDTKQKDSTV